MACHRFFFFLKHPWELCVISLRKKGYQMYSTTHKRHRIHHSTTKFVLPFFSPLINQCNFSHSPTSKASSIQTTNFIRQSSFLLGYQMGAACHFTNKGTRCTTSHIQATQNRTHHTTAELVLPTTPLSINQCDFHRWTNKDLIEYRSLISFSSLLFNQGTNPFPLFSQATE